MKNCYAYRHPYDQRKSGEISSRVIEDVAAVERALLDGTEQGTSAVLRIVGIITILFMMEPALAWGVFLPVPILLILGFFIQKNHVKYGRECARVLPTSTAYWWRIFKVII